MRMASPDPYHRDRPLLLLNAFAIVILTLLGAARGSVRNAVKVNTAKRRTNSLFRQGLYPLGIGPQHPGDRPQPQLMEFTLVALSARADNRPNSVCSSPARIAHIDRYGI